MGITSQGGYDIVVGFSSLAPLFVLSAIGSRLIGKIDSELTSTPHHHHHRHHSSLHRKLTSDGEVQSKLGLSSCACIRISSLPSLSPLSSRARSIRSNSVSVQFSSAAFRWVVVRSCVF